ncbi:MAG: cyclase family protein [Bryobacteraceae bacterium]
MRILTLAALAAHALHAQAVRPVSPAEFDRWMTELSSWGRWGKDDERGALNLITPAKRKEAARLVREGVSVTLSRDAATETAPDNPRPFAHQMLVHAESPNATSHGDSFSIAHHGLAHTHLDALCHYFYKERMYNGIPRSAVTAKGAARLSIYGARDGIFTRGVLVDIPRLKNVPYLEPGTPIYAEDLDAWERFARVKVQPGDALLVRTGRWARRSAKGPWAASDHLAGLHASSVRWLKARDIAVLGSDSASEVRPTGVEGIRGPVHTLVLVALGVPILDNCDLEALGDAAHQRKRWDFLLTTAPLTVPGATGSALNPIAVF